MEPEFTLRWLDPFENWGDHNVAYFNARYRENPTRHDSGLCNRMFHWELGYMICEMANVEDRISIVLQKKIWPELDLIELPYTFGASNVNTYQDWQSKFEYDTLYMKTVFDIKEQTVKMAKPITETKLISIFKNNKFSLKSGHHWYSNFEYHSIESLYRKMQPEIYKNYEMVINKVFGVHERPLQKIRIKHTEIHNLLEEKYAEYVGIHIRRGNGVTVTEEDYDNIKDESFKKNLKEWRDKNVTIQDEGYLFYHNEKYFEVMDKMLELNPTQLFYISHDMDDSLLEPFYKRYGNKIESSKTNRFYYETYYSNAGLDVPFLVNYGNVIDNVTDLFSLANCRMIISSPSSSWSHFATEYKKAIYAVINDQMKNIMDMYMEAFENRIKKKTII